MDIEKILDELRQERQQMEEAIASLERLASQAPKRRGRPPLWMAKAKGDVVEKAKPGRKPKQSAA
jgi:hypothetical protein